jgi:L-threonylcarbamoyladenylate synthase
VRAEILKINSEKPEISLVKYAADQIRAGEVLGMPTDTFYGLAADPFNLRAVDKVYDIKTRSRHKPLSLLIESIDQAEELAKPLPEEFYALARKFWPGPLTIIVRASSRLPLKVTANTGNVALRVPNAQIPLAAPQSAPAPSRCASSSKAASASLWMAGSLPAMSLPPSSISAMTMPAGASFVKAQSLPTRFPAFSPKDERPEMTDER